MSYPNNLSFNEKNIQVFFANGSSMQVWNKPPNAKFVHFYVIGGGGGGGAGATSAINTTKIGGGGGAGSSITIGLFPANVLPDILYLKVGEGGRGGIAGSTVAASYNGVAGGVSYVSIDPQTGMTAQNLILASANSSVNGFGAGGAASGGGGSAPTAWTAANSIFNDLGLVTSIAGDAGTTGSNTIGGSKSITKICIGGAGGGGYNNTTVTTGSGGTITANGVLSDSFGGAVSGGNGSGGKSTNIPSNYNIYSEPMYFYGGAGGGGINSGSGGGGGNAAYGAGGGGGGAGTTGGAGGRGGDGLIIITTI